MSHEALHQLLGFDVSGSRVCLHLKGLDRVQERDTLCKVIPRLAKGAKEQATDRLVIHDKGIAAVDPLLQVQAVGDVRELQQLSPLLAPAFVDVRPT